jgi:sulfhydrogenase subunit alpha
MSTPSDRKRARTLKVNYLARVEGEGALHVRIKGAAVTDVQLQIFEPPRFFEAFLRGRTYLEAPDLTARICGICPVAYQLGAAQAMEDACGVVVDGPLRLLRRLLYCGEWIESHALHIYLLHAPDFLGYQDAVQLARDAPEVVRRGLALKQVGNAVMALLGGREVHPVNLRVGGFYRVPAKAELAPLAERLQWARDAAYETVRLAAGFSFPDFTQDYTFVSLREAAAADGGAYPILGGRLVSSRGLDAPISAFEEHVRETHVPHSTALHAELKEHGPYVVGPLARFNLNADRLSPLAQAAAREAGLTAPCLNPFRSIVVRSVELLYACDEALRLIDAYTPPARPYIDVPPRAGTGYGCTEAPRGLCWHRYTLDRAGLIRDARIVPPTSQNQKAIEADLRRFVETHLDLPEDELQWACEQGVRNYDPCISCSCHFLQLHLDRS